MSSDRSDTRTQASNNYKEPGKAAAIKCRIPQRLASLSARKPINASSIARGRSFNCTDPKVKYEVIPTPNSRFGARYNTRPRNEEARPKSAGRLKEELFFNRPTQYLSTRFAKPCEKVIYTQKRQSTLTRKMAENHKSGRIIVPTQETQRKFDDLELRLSEGSGSPAESPEYSEQHEGDKSITQWNDQTMELKICWQTKTIQFEHMKQELKSQQKKIMEQYAVMRDIHQKLLSLGEEVNLPSSEDLYIMNVAKMTPEQLLQLCADDVIALPDNHYWDDKIPLQIDMNKFYEIPTKLVHTCEQTLAKRKEIIDWFQSLTKEEKGISMNKLSKKVNEFNAENEMLKSSVDLAKAEFLKELDEIVNLMRKGLNKTMTLRLRTEQLTLEMSELNSQNMDLKKAIRNAENLRSPSNRIRLEELEKELKEEKCKRLVLRDRLCRSEGQVKINMERASQLEATLEQARSQIWTLERTVQQLNDQNQKLQNEFEEELKKLNESIKEHTTHLEEIADARAKLQIEKEDLEKRLLELSECYNESLNNLKEEKNVNVGKLIEIERKCEEQGEDKKRLEERLESLCSQLVEAELRHKDTLQHLHLLEEQLDKEKAVHKELESTQKELEQANTKINCNNDVLTKQNETIKEFERSIKEAAELIEALKGDVSNKGDCIAEMEKKQALLEHQLQENENKMEAYIEQLSSLKTHIKELQEEFGDFENVNELREKLFEATRQNGELAEALQKKNEKLEQYNESLSEHEKLLLEREDIIKMLSEKEEEQTNIIKILRNNLAMRSKADNDLSYQIKEKNIEIDSLVVNLDTRKQKVSNLEKIILELEDQTRKASQKRKKDQAYITHLEKKLTEYESFHMEASRNADSPDENLDSLIKILEDELEASFDPGMTTKDHDYTVESKKKYTRDQNHEKPDAHEDIAPQSRFNPEPLPTKIVTGNFVKKTYFAGGEQYSGDNLDRKKGITNIDTQKWVSTTEPGYNVPTPLLTKDNLSNRRLVPGSPQKTYFTRNLLQMNLEQQRDDKRYKMFKIAGHKL